MEEDLDKIMEILRNTRVIAVVGISRDPEKNACTVPEYLQEHGYRIIPVNPNAAEGTILEEEVYESLLEIPNTVDMVQVFRPSEELPPIADSAVQIGAKYLWMQSGISNEEAAKTAESAGLLVVMDMCARVCHRLLSGQGKL
jgi:predicted CoA-binding protein